MSRYRNPRLSRKPDGASRVGLWAFKTPGTIRADLDRLDASMKSMEQDARAGVDPSANAMLLASWEDFYAGWRRYYDSSPSVWWGSTADEIEKQAADLKGWRIQLAKAGVKVSAPPFSPDAPNDGESWKGIAKGLALGAGVVAILALLKR